MLADELLGQSVELAGGDSRLRVLAEQRDRAGDDAPARSMPSISAADLRTITLRHLLERTLDLGEDFVLAPIRVDADDVSARAVVLDQRLCLRW